MIEPSVSEIEIKLTLENTKLKSKIESLSKQISNQSAISNNDKKSFHQIPGVIVLGMHRSGTSVVGGLMTKMGLNVGSPLIEAAEDNAKGFFERVDVVLQNDILMRMQKIDYSSGTYKFDNKLALQQILTSSDYSGTKVNLRSTELVFKEGMRGLKFLNDVSNYPWMLKDPRLCITLRTWLPLLNFIPAILFIFRHPVDVALSLNHREGFAIARGLRMWYVYNRQAVLQSNDLCRVVGNQRTIMSDSRVELDRIYSELREGCGVPVPHRVSDSDLASFIDVSLQHGKSADRGKLDPICDSFSLGDLNAIHPPSYVFDNPTPAQATLFGEVMRVYCGFESGSVFQPGFKWDMTITD